MRVGKQIERRLVMTRSSSPAQVVLATVGVAMALLLAALDQTIVGVAMPRIVSELHGLDYYAWVTTAYLITSTALVPVAGKLGDMFGRKPFLIAGMIGFVAASALCGVFGISSVVGPTLGGFLTDGPGWRWVFYVNVPMGVLAVVLVATQLPRV